MAWWKKLLVFLGLAALGGLFIYGGCGGYVDSRHYAEKAASYSSTEPGPLLFSITLLLGGVILLIGALLVIGPEDALDFGQGFFWTQGLRGVAHILASLISFLLPPLFVWQLWVLLTEYLLKGYPPIAWHRVGGVLTDWVIFFAMLIPWLLVALAGIIGPFVVFWMGVSKPERR